MQDTDKSSLSPYQNAILTEMGISSWTLVKGQGAQQKQEAKDDPVMTPVSGTTKPDLRQTSSTDNALARLAEMKNSKTNGNGSNVHKEPQKASQTVKSEILPKTLLSTDKVLLALSTVPASFVNDVLLAMNIEKLGKTSIEKANISDYSSYPLAWQESDQVDFANKLLSTPEFPLLNDPQVKRQLWLAIQNSIGAP